MKRKHLFMLLLFSISCAEFLHAGAWFLGKWIIVRTIRTPQGIHAVTDTQVKYLINQTVELSSVVAKSGGEEIGNPQYRTTTVTRFDFYANKFKHVDPAELGIDSDPVIIIEVTDADNKEWTHVGGTLIVKDVDTLITIWDGVFFEMKRADSVNGKPTKTQPSFHAPSYDLFRRAIMNESTAPNYVLITVVNGTTNETQLVCTVAPFLLGAIHEEYKIPYDDTGCRNAMRRALAQRDRMFRFSQELALKNIGSRYSKQILGEMRAALKGLSDEELRKGFTGFKTKLSELYSGRSYTEYSAYRDAIAHVLLERGLLPRQGCVAGYLTIDE